MTSGKKKHQTSGKQEGAESRPAMAKLVSAIAGKRRELGFVEWGMLPIEEVVDRIVEKPPEADKAKNLKPCLYDPPKDDGSDLPLIV